MKRQQWFILGTLLLTASLLGQAGFAARAASFQSPGSLDTTFDPGAGANDIVFAVARQPDGKVLIGGQFTQVNNVTHNGIARLGPDGSLEAAYTAGLTGAGFSGLTSIAIQPSDGKAVVGGLFDHVNGTARASIARLDDAGALDTTFDPGTGVTGGDGYLNVVKLQSNGRVLIGGAFTTFNETPRSNIARLNSAGALDTSFDPGSGANGEVTAIAIQPSDGSVLIGGYFTSVNGEMHNGLARLGTNGSLDKSFAPDVNGAVLAIAVQSDNKILIGGKFTLVNSTERDNIARLDSNGNLDTGYDPNASAEVDAIALQPDGKAVIGGKFTLLGTTGRIRIARLNLDGSVNTGFDPGGGASGGILTVYAVELLPGGKVLLGGGFQSIDGVGRNRIARLWGDRWLSLPMMLR